MTPTRWLRPSTSSISELISRIAEPARARSTSSRWISAFAPTSMPRVGSSRMISRGLPASHLPITTFCWFPPLSERPPDSSPPRATSRTLAASSPVRRRSAPLLSQPPHREADTEPSTTLDRLSRMGRSRNNPSCARSSVTNAIPAAIAARTSPRRSGLPSTSIRPVFPPSPKTARATSVRPEPMSPASPKISPWAMSNEIPCTRALSSRSRTDSMTSGRGRGRAGCPRASSRPTMSDSRVVRSSSAVGRSPTTRPSRITTTRPLSLAISSR